MLIRRNRTKRANFRGKPLFEATYNNTTENSLTNLSFVRLMPGSWREEKGKRLPRREKEFCCNIYYVLSTHARTPPYPHKLINSLYTEYFFFKNAQKIFVQNCSPLLFFFLVVVVVVILAVLIHIFEKKIFGTLILSHEI